MAWYLQGTLIPAPQGKTIERDIQSITHRTLDGSHTRDFIGSEKKVFECDYTNIKATDMTYIISQYEDQRDNGTAKNLIIEEISFNGSVLVEIGNQEYRNPNFYEWGSLKVVFREV